MSPSTRQKKNVHHDRRVLELIPLSVMPVHRILTRVGYLWFRLFLTMLLELRHISAVAESSVQWLMTVVSQVGHDHVDG